MCEACGGEGPTKVVRDPADGIAPYTLCADCEHRIKSYALRPREWFNLARSRGATPYFLHDDFYDDDGNAQQSEIDVENPELHPFPTRAEWVGNLAVALEVAFSRWTLSGALVSDIKEFPKDQVLHELSRALSHRPPSGIEARSYEIAARALGGHASEWVRERWQRCSFEAFSSLVLASARCLPQAEAAPIVIEQLQRMPRPLAMQQAWCLAWLADRRVLRVVEEFVGPPVTEDWGRLAACCQYSWSDAVGWLGRGRPLSLVALDALTFCIRSDTDVLAEVAPTLRDPPALTELTAVLEEHRSADAVPRVSRAVGYLLEHGPDLIMGVRAT